MKALAGAPGQAAEIVVRTSVRARKACVWRTGEVETTPPQLLAAKPATSPPRALAPKAAGAALVAAARPPPRRGLWPVPLAAVGGASDAGDDGSDRDEAANDEEEGGSDPASSDSESYEDVLRGLRVSAKTPRVHAKQLRAAKAPPAQTADGGAPLLAQPRLRGMSVLDLLRAQCKANPSTLHGRSAALADAQIKQRLGALGDSERTALEAQSRRAQRAKQLRRSSDRSAHAQSPPQSALPPASLQAWARPRVPNG